MPPLTLQALEAGKNVFVEKPLGADEEDLDRIEAFYADRADGPLLMTGFNRRFSPAVARLRELLSGRTSPLVANYRMNAGYIPLDHWVHGPEAAAGTSARPATSTTSSTRSSTPARSPSRRRRSARRAATGRRTTTSSPRSDSTDGSVCTLDLHGARPPRPPEGAARRLRGRPGLLARRLQVAHGRRRRTAGGRRR